MPNATFFVYTNKDAIHTVWGLAFRNNFPPRPASLRKQVSTVYVAATSTLLHGILQMPPAARAQFARDFCDYMPHVPNSATAIGLESIFFTLASDPATAKILFDFAPLSLWLGRANAEPAERSAGAAFIDLSQPQRGALFSREKVSAMMKGGAYYDAIVARPNTFVSSLLQLADAYITNPGTASLKIVDRPGPMDQLRDDTGDMLSPMVQVDASETAALFADALNADPLEAVGVFSANPRTWSAGTWAKAFGALGALIVAGALFATGAAPVGLWALNVALLAVDAAVMAWADGALSAPSLSYSNHGIPDLPEGIVLIEAGTAIGLHIDEGPDATPVQPP
jgi:hypothetical protein